MKGSRNEQQKASLGIWGLGRQTDMNSYAGCHMRAKAVD
jgi:hypothetical protein